MTSEPTAFLYPFIEADERDPSPLLVDLAASARAKMVASVALRETTLKRYGPSLAQVGRALAARFRTGGRLFAFGNGGSATDAEGTVDLFRHPPHGVALPAMSLVDDRAVLTALANDVGFDLVFSRQLIAHAQPMDMVVGLSTSGGSANVLAAFEEAAHLGLCTVGLCGYEGGAMAVSDTVDHCFVVRSDSVHRIQETQDAVVFALWGAVQQAMSEGTAA
ncbi:MAG: D-sedoheptulose-7-phosphate isomerase [Acidimicrobiales bacterium]